MPSKTFIKITNKDIYERLETLIKTNQKDHSEIIEHQIKTNGKVKLNRWIASTALGLVILIMGTLIRSIIGG